MRLHQLFFSSNHVCNRSLQAILSCLVIVTPSVSFKCNGASELHILKTTSQPFAVYFIKMYFNDDNFANCILHRCIILHLLNGQLV